MEMLCASSSHGLWQVLSLLSARESEAKKEFANGCKAVAGMDVPCYTHRKKMSLHRKNDKLESAGKTLRDLDIKLTVIFRGHIAEWRAGTGIRSCMY